MSNPTPKVAIVHDWIIGGGAELVVLELHRMYPEAPIYTSYCTDEWRQKLDDKVVTGYLQHWPFSKLRKFLPLLRFWWFNSLDLSKYDLVISSSGNGEAKNIRVPNGKHICYCHTPTHFYWRHYQQYLEHPGFGPLGSIGLRLLAGPLRRKDFAAAQRPEVFVANSTHIQKDIKTYYNRDSVVVHPPVPIERFTRKHNGQRRGFITVGRQVPYKKVDLLIEACNKLKLPLTVIGDGPEHGKLAAIAGPTITLKSNVSDEEVATAISAAEAFLFAAFEDFGITPVEALSAGTPVIAFKGGGALDYIKPGVNGSFFEAQTVDSISAALQTFNTRQYNADKVALSARAFSADGFRKAMMNVIDKAMEENA